jgi:hypothetical protein
LKTQKKVGAFGTLELRAEEFAAKRKSTLIMVDLSEEANEYDIAGTRVL